MTAPEQDAELLSRAIIVWTGKGETARPERDEARLVERVGRDLAVALLPTIRALEQEFYESDAREWAASDKEMFDAAAERFRARHPELSDDAVAALAWCYAFDFK